MNTGSDTANESAVKGGCIPICSVSPFLSRGRKIGICNKFGDVMMGLFNRKKDDFIKIKVEKLIDWNEPNGEGCVVSDRITKEGFKVGYMYREKPTDGNPDSGWRFMAGNEDDEYMNNPNKHHLFAINTICNYDQDIIPYLKSEIGSAYIRTDSNRFEIDDGSKPIYVEKQNR